MTEHRSEMFDGPGPAPARTYRLELQEWEVGFVYGAITAYPHTPVLQELLAKLRALGEQILDERIRARDPAP